MADEKNPYYDKYLDERFRRLETDVDKILTNHLPHIQIAVNDLSKNMTDRFESLEQNITTVQTTNLRWIIATMTTIALSFLALFLQSKFK
jgi:hypothetical protein